MARRTVEHARDKGAFVVVPAMEVGNLITPNVPLARGTAKVTVQSAVERVHAKSVMVRVTKEEASVWRPVILVTAQEAVELVPDKENSGVRLVTAAGRVAAMIAHPATVLEILHVAFATKVVVAVLVKDLVTLENNACGRILKNDSC